MATAPHYVDEWAQVAAEEAAAARENLRKRLTLRDNAYPLTRKEARAVAKDVVRDCTNAATGATDADESRAHLAAICEGMGVAYPASEYGHAPEVARLSAVDWWGRQIRRKDWREWEARQIRLGNVRHFVSDEIAKARTWHRETLAEMLAGIFAMRDDGGAVMSLADLASRSNANPVIRRAEMITRAKGLATWRREQGFTWTFVTLTAPSKYHRMRHRDGRLEPNPKWQGALPRETQQYLCAVWARIRAKCARAGIEWSAMRTVEPHANGTPHWHMCVFVDPRRLDEFKAIVRFHALAEDGTEPGADQHRATFQDWRPADGDMVDRCIAYLVAYVSKNLDGAKSHTGESMGAATDTVDGESRELGDAIESARRVEAWATTWGIRQFQEIGGAPISAWRELRRVREPLADGNPLEPLRAAADGGRYAEFLPMAKAAGVKVWADSTRDRLQQAAAQAGIEFAPTVELADLATQKGLLNKWGEPARVWVKGVRATIAGKALTLITRFHTWAVVDCSNIKVSARAVEFVRGEFWKAASTLAMLPAPKVWAGMTAAERSREFAKHREIDVLETKARAIAGVLERAGFSLLAGDSPPRTRVNNCTEGGRG